MTKTITNQHFTGERALFMCSDIRLVGCLLDDGESHIKQSANVVATDCTFGWKYPLWYGNNLAVSKSTLLPTARAAIWYSNNVNFTDVAVQAPKAFRRCNGLTLTDVEFSDAAETLWACSNVTMSNVHVAGNYFGMNSTNIVATNLTIDGNYCFDGGKNIVIRDSVLNSKDSFWNCDNVTVYDTVIRGEYLGWNSRNLTFVNCTIESLQGLCFVDGLNLVNCKLPDTTLCFEYCDHIDADITGNVISVKNPLGGKIVADGFDEIILDDNNIDHDKTQLIVR